MSHNWRGTIGVVVLASALTLTGCSSDKPKQSPTAGSSAASRPATAGQGTSSAPTTEASASATGAGQPTGGLATEPSVAETTAPAVPISSPAAFGAGFSARLVKFASVKVTDEGPGALTGRDATAFTVEFTNGSDMAISLDTVQVNVTYGKLAASPANLGSGAAAGELQPGRTAQATYTFAIPNDSRNDVKVAVWVDPAHVTVLFAGAVK